MMIQKYTLGLYSGHQSINLPMGAEILGVETIQNIGYLWVYANEFNTFETRRLLLVMERMSIFDTLKYYLGKLELNDHTCYHVLELI